MNEPLRTVPSLHIQYYVYLLNIREGPKIEKKKLFSPRLLSLSSYRRSSSLSLSRFLFRLIHLLPSATILQERELLGRKTLSQSNVNVNHTTRPSQEWLPNSIIGSAQWSRASLCAPIVHGCRPPPCDGGLSTCFARPRDVLRTSQKRKTWLPYHPIPLPPNHALLLNTPLILNPVIIPSSELTCCIALVRLF